MKRSDEGEMSIPETLHRWIQPLEVRHLLDNLGRHPQVTNELPFRSKPGSIVVVQPKSHQKWKTDGYQYVSRTNTSGYKESQKRVGKNKEIVCKYSSIDESDSIYEDYQISQDYTLVHSSQDKNKSKDELFTNLIGYTLQRRIYFSIESKNPVYIVQYFYNLKKNELRGKKDLKLKGGYEFESKLNDSKHSTKVDSRGDIMNDLFDQSMSQNLNSIEQSIQDNCETDSIASFIDTESFNRNRNNFPKMESTMEESQRIKDLEEKVRKLTNKLSNLEISSNKKQDSDNDNQNQKLCINDFSPEWDYIEGGSKMIICCNLPVSIDCKNESIMVAFGSRKVQGHLIQKGVIKCYVPEVLMPAKVIIRVIINSETLICAESIDTFEFRSLENSQKNTFEIAADEDTMIGILPLQHSDQLFKVRLVEKIQNIKTFGETYLPESLFLNDFNGLLSDSQSSLLEQDETLAPILENLMLESEKIDLKDQARELIQKPDKNGFCLVHYLAKFRLNECLSLMLDHGINFRVYGKGGISPLHICLWEDNYCFIDKLQNSEDGKELLEEIELDNLEDEGIDTKFNSLMRQISRVSSLKKNQENQNIQERGNPSVDCSDTDEDTSLIEFMKMISRSDKVTQRGQLQNGFSIDVASITERRRFLDRKRKVRKLQNKKFLDKNRQDTNTSRWKPMNLEGRDAEVKLIQKNVRCWISRKQYLDVKYAVKVLEKCRLLALYFQTLKNGIIKGRFLLMNK